MKHESKNHIMEAYDHEINKLEIMIHSISHKALEQLKKLNIVFQKSDKHLANTILILDKEINELNESIENRVIQTIALWQPLADDLRNILYSIKVAADVERMADHIKNVAHLYNKHNPKFTKYQHLLHNICHMINNLIQMLESIVFFKKNSNNIAILYEVCNQDQAIDMAFDNLFKYLIEFMNKDQENLDICMALLFIIKNLERVGDLIVNIAQYFYYILTAKKIKHEY